ncbi:MAG TPA: hypothetical protein DF296_14355, partial [Candidatus Margulisbacteria bacterium]|nr:hypothetical protein [Candidatus Margulisiibacteriota bacterium]
LIVSDPKKGLAILKDLDLGNYEYEKKNIIQESFLSLSETDPKKAKEILDYSGDEKSDILWNYAVKKTDKNRNSVDVLSDVMVRYVMPPLQHNSNEKIDNLTTMKKLKEALVEYSALNRSAAAKNSEGKSINATDVIMQKYLRQLVTTDWMTKNPEMRAEHAALNDVLNALDAVKTGKNIQDVYSSLTALDKKDGDADKSRWALFLECQSSVSITAEEKIKLTLKAAGSTKIELSTGRKLLNLISGGAKNTGNKSVLTTSDITKLTGLPQDEVVKTLSTMEKSKQLTSESTGKSLPVIEKDQAPEQKDQSKTEGTDKSKPETSVQMDEKSEKTEKTEETKKAEDDKSIYGKDQVKKNELKKSKLVEDSRSAFEIIKIDGVSLKLDANGKAQVVIDNLRYSSKAELSKLQERLAKADAKKILAKEGISSTDNIRFVWASATDINVDNEISKKLEAPGGKIQEKVNAYGPQLISMLIAYDGKNGKNIGIEQVGNSYQFIDLSTGLGIRIGDSTYLAKEEFEKLHADIQEQSQSIDKILKQACKDNGLDPENAKHQAAIKQAYSIDNTGNVRVANDVVDHGVYNLKEYVEHFGAVKVEAIIDGVKKSFYVDKEIYESIKSQQVDGAPVDKEKMDKLKSEVALESERAAIFTAIQKQGNFEKEQQEMEANFYNSLLNFKMKDIISSKRLALNLDIVAVTDFENGVVDRSKESIDRALSDIKQLNLNNVTGKDFQALENKLKQAQEDLIALNKTLTSMPENAGDEEISKIREEAQITVTKINESISSMNKDLIKIRIDNNTSSKFMINCITAESRNLDTKQIDEKVQLRDFILSVKDMPDTVSKETFTETLAKMKLSDESRVTINKLIDEQLGSKTEISKQDLMKNLQKVMITLDSELKNYPDYFADRMDAHSEAGKLIAKFVTPDNQIAVSELNGLIEKDAMLTSEQKTEIKKIIQENANGLSEIDKRVLTKGISDKLSSISDILNNNSDFVEAFNSLGYKESVVMEKYNNMVIKAKQSSAITEEMSEPDRKKVYEECWKKAQEISMSEYITYGNNNFGLKGKAMSFTYGVGKGFITGAGYTSVANLRKFATDKDYTWEQYGEELLEGGKGWAIFHMKQSAFQMLGVQAAVHSGGVGAGKIGVNAGDSALKKLGTGMKWTGKEVYSGAKGSLKGMYGEGTNAAVFTFDLLTSIADFKRNGQEGMIPMAVVNTTASWMAFEGATKAGTSVAETVFAKKMLGNVLPKKYQLAANAIGTLSGVVGSEVVGGMVSDNLLATWINSRFQMLNERNDNFHKANLMIGDFSNVQLAKVVSSGLQKGAVSDVAAIKYLSNGLKVAKGTPLVIVTASGFSTYENWGNLTSNNSQMQWAGARNVALDTGGAVVAAGGFVAGTSIAASIAAGGLTIAGVSGATGVGAPVAVVVLVGTGGAVLCTFAYEGIKESLINDNVDNKKMLNEEFGKAVPGFELKVRDEEERDTDNVKGSIEQRYNAAMINAFMQDNFTMNNVSGLSKYKNLSGYIGDYLNNDMSVVTLKDVVRNLNIKSLEMDSIYELTPDMLFNILDAAAKEKIENGAKDLDIKVSGFDNSTLNYESFGMTADFTINVNGKDIPKNDIHIANYQTQDRGGLLEARADGNIPIKEFEGFCMDDNKARPMFMRTMASLYNTGALDKLRANYEEQIKTATRMDKSADVSKYKEKIELLDQLLENMKTKNVMSLESITDVNFGQEKQNEKLVGILAEGLHCFVNGLSEKGCTNEQIASIKNIMNYKYNKESEAKELIRVGESPELIPAQAIEMINSYEKLTSDIPVDDRNSSMDIIAARISVMNKVSEVVNKINTANAKIDLAGLCEKITPEDFAKLSPDQQKMMANTLFGSLFQAYTQQKLTTQELAKELSQLLAKKPFFKEAFKSSDLNSTFLANVCTQFYNSSVAYAVFQHIIDNNPDADTIDKLFTKVTAEKISDLGDLIKNGKVTDNNLKDELIKEITTAQGAGNKGLSDFLIDNVLRKSCSVSIDEIEKLKGNDKKDQLKLNFDYKDANGKGTKESVEETSANRFRLLSACYRKGLISEDELKEKIKNNNTFEAIMLDDYSLFRSEDDIKNKSDLDAEIELLNKSMELFKQKQNELNKATLKLGKSLEVDGLKYNSQDLRMKHFIEKNNLGASASAEGNPAMIEEIWLSTKAYETGVGRFQTLYDDFMSDQAKNGKSDHNVVLGNYNQFTKDLSAFLNTNKQKYSGYFSVIAYSQNPDIVVRLNSMTPEASTDLESDFMKWADKKGVKAFTPQADVIDFKNPACINYLENMQDVCGVYMHTDNVDTSGSWNKLKDLCGQNDFSDKKVFDAHSKELCSLLDKIGKDSKLESWQTQLVEDFRAQLSGWKFGSWGSAVEDSPAAMVFLMKLSMIDDDGLQTQKRLLLTEIRKEILGAGFFDIEEKWSADFAKDYEQLIRSIDVTGMSGNQEEIEKMSEELNHYLSEINSNSKLSAISGPVVQAIKAKMYELSKYNYSQLSKLAENNDPTSNLIALDSLDEKLQKGTNIDSLLVIDGRASVYAFVLYKELNAQGRLDNLQSKDVESIKQAIKNDSYKEFKDVFDSAWYNITTTDEKRNEEFQSLTNQLIDSYKSSKLFASMDNSRITKEIIFARKERLSSANDKVRLYLNYLEQNCGKEWKQKLQKGISKLVQDNNGNVRKAFDLIQNNNSLIDEMLSKEGINQSVQKYLAKYIASNKDSIIGAAQSTKGSTSVSDFLPTSEEQYPGEELINQAAANVSLYR